jgi:hypothetical protein
MTKPPDEERIRDHGKIVTAPAGTSEQQVIDNLTGADQLPPIGQELGRPPAAPPFDPHEGREVEHGREFDKPEPMITTMVFMGIDRGGDFEDRVQSVVNEAEKLGLEYVTATIGTLDLDRHVDLIADIAEEVEPDEDEEENS